MPKTALLAAGGTGGHLFPAEALACELVGRGWEVHLVTDERARRYAGRFPHGQIHVVKSATPGGRNPFQLAGAAWTLWRGYLQSRRLLKETRASLVIGFGGYPTLPPLLAAQMLGIPNLIHDANAVMGRANRMLARGADKVAMGFPGVAPEGAVVTGNPVRPPVVEAAAEPYPSRGTSDPFHLLVFGGSQGAQYFGEVLPAAIGLLSAGHRGALRVVHQVREEQIAFVRDAYAQLGIEAEIAPFFEDMPARIAAAHFVISRAGASTVSELGVIGRPSLLVPYPYALDHDQARNARTLADAGGATVMAQRDLGPEKLAQVIADALDEPERLAKMAQTAKEQGSPNAAGRLAALAEELVDGRKGEDRK